LNPSEAHASAIQPGAGASCPLCGEMRRHYLFRLHGLVILQCPKCELISQTGPAGDRKVEAPSIDTPTERRAARDYVAELHARGVQPGARVLVVGPTGHPFEEEAIRSGLTVACRVSAGDLEAGVELATRVDAAVVLGETERAADPLLLLRRVREALRPGGTLLLVTQATDSWACRFFKRQWVGWNAARGFYFSRKTIHLMLLKSGFGRTWIESDRRLYTLDHIAKRAAQCPRTVLTQWIAFAGRWTPAALRRWRIRLVNSGIVVTAKPEERRVRFLVSIVVPVYNEQSSFITMMDALLARPIQGADREIIVVESNSTDGTHEAVLRYRDHPEVRVFFQDRPRGKGNAVKEGFSHAQGDIVMIQDADLEYDLSDYDALLEPLLSHAELFVLGARHGGHWKMRQFSQQKALALAFNLAHVFFTTLINTLYGQRMKDPFTMYKVFRKDCLYGLSFECNHFDFDHELVIKLARKGYAPLEIPVNYRSRSYQEGKKVSMFREPLRWIWTDVKNRLVPLRRHDDAHP
jgi:hypothetical protein